LRDGSKTPLDVAIDRLQRGDARELDRAVVFGRLRQKAGRLSVSGLVQKFSCPQPRGRILCRHGKAGLPRRTPMRGAPSPAIKLFRSPKWGMKLQGILWRR
jgi:hypothetical protein